MPEGMARFTTKLEKQKKSLEMPTHRHPSVEPVSINNHQISIFTPKKPNLKKELSKDSSAQNIDRVVGSIPTSPSNSNRIFHTL